MVQVKRSRAAAVKKPEPRVVEGRRIAVVVLGMHRSGTSALTRVLSLVGCDLPRNLVGGNKSNETGHWESVPICRLNDRILSSAGTRWDDWTRVNEGWFRSPKMEEFRPEALSVLAEEFGSSRLFVLKDPRLCRLMPFWETVLSDAGADARYILPVRNPVEVAQSLEKRNGFDSGLGHLLWLRHVLDAERSTRGRRRLVATYDDLMARWAYVVERAGAELEIEWPRLSPQVADEIETFLSPQLRHHREDSQRLITNPAVPQWVRDAYAILLRWAEDGEKPQDHARLDAISAEFDIAAPAFARLVNRGNEHRRANTELRTKVDGLEAQLAETARLADESSTRKEQAEQASAQIAQAVAARKQAEEQARLMSEQAAREAGNLARQIAALEADAEKREAAMAELADQLAQVRTEAERLRQVESDFQTRVASYQQRLGEGESVIAGLRRELSEVQQFTEENERLAEENERLAAELVSARDRLAETESALAQRRHEADETAQALAQATARIGEIDTARAAAMADTKRLASELERARGAEVEARRLARELEKSRAAVREAELKVSRQTMEISSLSSILMEREREIGDVKTKGMRELGRSIDTLKSIGRWSVFTSKSRLKTRMKFVESLEIFDGPWYLKMYPDVAASGIDPLLHYVEFGAAEGRAPNASMLRDDR